MGVEALVKQLKTIPDWRRARKVQDSVLDLWVDERSNL